jgi:ribosomal protein S18 acetylase RimI-like enzyme
VIHFRTFRNTDPPGLLRIWNEAINGRAAAPLRNASLLEHFLLAKPYFDPAGLIVADDEGVLAGFALAGFGPNPAQSGIDRSRGVICILAVLPDYRRKGIGTTLLRQGEDYLKAQGASDILAGPMAPLNPFTFGLYGGSNSPGFLESDTDLGPFLQQCGYQAADTVQVMQRHLDRPFNIVDARFPDLRRRFEVRQLPRRGSASWYQECVRGPLEIDVFRLEEKETGQTVGRARIWELDPFNPRWNEHAIGVLHVEIEPSHRRQGLARLLLGNVLRFYHDQYFTLVEAQVRQSDAPGVALLRGLGFQPIDTGYQYRLKDQEN